MMRATAPVRLVSPAVGLPDAAWDGEGGPARWAGASGMRSGLRGSPPGPGSSAGSCIVISLHFGALVALQLPRPWSWRTFGRYDEPNGSVFRPPGEFRPGGFRPAGSGVG